MNRQMKYSLGIGLLSVLMGLYIVGLMPHDREVKSLSIFLFKLLPFFLAAISISLLDVELLRRWHLHLIFIICCFLLFFTVYIPRMFFDVFVGDGGNVYYMTLIIVPIVILSLAVAFRMGGGGSGDTLRLSVALLLIMISGIEDLAFFVVNTHEPGRFNPVPEVWDWVSHLKVRIGHSPSRTEVMWSVVIHFMLAAFVLFYPFRLVSKLGTRFFAHKENDN